MEPLPTDPSWRELASYALAAVTTASAVFSRRRKVTREEWDALKREHIECEHERRECRKELAESERRSLDRHHEIVMLQIEIAKQAMKGQAALA